MELEATLLLLQTSIDSLVAVDLLLSNVPEAQRVLEAVAAASSRTAQPTTMGIWRLNQAAQLTQDRMLAIHLQPVCKSMVPFTILLCQGVVVDIIPTAHEERACIWKQKVSQGWQHLNDIDEHAKLQTAFPRTVLNFSMDRTSFYRTLYLEKSALRLCVSHLPVELSWGHCSGLLLETAYSPLIRICTNMAKGKQQQRLLLPMYRSKFARCI